MITAKKVKIAKFKIPISIFKRIKLFCLLIHLSYCHRSMSYSLTLSFVINFTGIVTVLSTSFPAKLLLWQPFPSYEDTGLPCLSFYFLKSVSSLLVNHQPHIQVHLFYSLYCLMQLTLPSQSGHLTT